MSLTNLNSRVASLTVGHAVYAASQWGMISVLARLGNPEIVGQYALGVAVSAPILLLAPFSRRTHSQTTCAADIRIMSLVFALLGIAAVGFLEHSLQDRAAVAIVAMAQSVEAIAALYSGRRDTLSLLLHGGLSVAVLSLLVAATGRPGAGLLGVLIVRLLILICYDLRRPGRTALGRPPGERLYEPPPEAADALLVPFIGSVPCFFVAHMLGYRWLGLFAAIASLTPIANGLISALGQAAAPQLARLYRDGECREFRRVAVQLTTVGLILGLLTVAGSILAGPALAGFLFGPEYGTQVTLLLALAGAGAVGYVASLLSCLLSAGRRFDEEIPMAIAAITAASLASVALIPRLGIAGAAEAAAFGYLVHVTGQMWVLRSILRQRPRPVLKALLNQPVELL